MSPALPLLADTDAEPEALHAHARVWEPARRALLADLDLPADARVADIGRGAPGRTELGPDDTFHSGLPAGTFDLVHARFQLAPAGRAADQLAAFRRLLKPGGVLVLEEPDTRSWTFSPHAPATTHLIGRIAQAYRTVGGDLDMGRRLAGLLRGAGLAPSVRTHAIGLEAGHPYLRLPLQLADSLQDRLEDVFGSDGLAALRRDATAELDDPDRHGTTFTLVQAWARL
jgi:SAM-dependent methyltransferase